MVAPTCTAISMAENAQPPARRIRQEACYTVSIEVTSNHNEATFQVPKALICARSKPISVHCATRSDVFELDGYHDLDILNTYLQLLYTGQIVLEPSRAEHDEDCLKTISDFLALYEVVDELDDRVAKNAITDALVRYLQGARSSRPEGDLSEVLYRALRDLEPACPARRVLVCFAACEYGSERFARRLLGDRVAGPGLLFELVVQYQRVIAQGTAGRSFAEYDGEEFHVSENEEEERCEIARDMLKNHFQEMVTGSGGFGSCEAREYEVGEEYWDQRRLKA
ncbi:hypothetical protein Tdes44962_MAKER08818 [Teratosphaeria destructans]|uniref:BTB domain-containing protein n=1 Tax=Teratosphaeria destructans TaxID=418781 RepID=A0A9W7W3R9_9PEZI|nr:hypothetical protein Tdes44962_MAKER08818 [Teratosphaeria destructans]